MNRINYVSFIDSTGINEMKDEEYDNILMNLTKYVDLVFLYLLILQNYLLIRDY